MASRHVTSFMLEMLLKLTKNNSTFAKINETCQENYYRLEGINKV